MRPRLIILILFTGLSSVAQQTSQPLITPISKPFGNISSTKMGTEGGALKSADGNLTVIVPAGALPSETTISIQPVDNGPSGNQIDAYQLEPSGVRFEKPVQLVFKYAGSNENADIKGIATQDESGLWWEVRKIKTDTIAKTITCYVPHFSKWALFERLVLEPKKTSIAVTATLRLTIVELSSDEEFLEDLTKKNASDDKNLSQDGDLLTPLRRKGTPANNANPSSDAELLHDLKPKYKAESWTVNGIENGNSEVGTVNGGKDVAIYKAPAKVPNQNPVAVSAKVTGMAYTPTGGSKMKTLYLVAEVEIHDHRYKFTFIQVSNNLNGVLKVLDSSTCVVELENGRPVLKNIVNHKLWSDWPKTNKRGCELTYLDPDGWKGQAEISGMTGGMMTPGSEKDPSRDFLIQLTPAFGSTPAMKEDCKCRGCTPRQVESFPLPAQPRYIHFKVNEDDVNVEYMGIWGKNEIERITKGEGFVVKIAKL